jgi:flagellar hook-length control protein FliK
LYVAEQVKYWISNDVKNAEMRLDGIGNNPVEVSISMQGNEARVAFRSDEAQARDVLEAASSHLKDLLQREGLVLSGVSVGTTGSGNAGSQQRREQQGARQAREVAAAQSVASQAATSGPRASGRALDLFV